MLYDKRKPISMEVDQRKREQSSSGIVAGSETSLTVMSDTDSQHE